LTIRRANKMIAAAVEELAPWRGAHVFVDVATLMPFDEVYDPRHDGSADGSRHYGHDGLHMTR
jgi:hypothetical protein